MTATLPIRGPATSALDGAPFRPFVRDLPAHVGERVRLCGWVAAVRRTKSIAFLTIRDRTGEAQAVCRDLVDAETLGALTPESAVAVTGTVEASTSARFGSVEIEAESVTLVAPADTPLPIDDGAQGDVRLDYRFLDLRRRDGALMFDVQTTLETAMRDWLLARGFLEVHTPKITAGGSESGAAVFELPYFGQTACLVQSPQFYTQLAMAAGFDRVFEVGPVFRAEAAVTNRHATEFTCVDVELSWLDSHEELMAIEESLLRHALSTVRDRHGDDVERHFGVAVEVPEGPIPRIAVADVPRLVGGGADEAGGRLTHRSEQALSKYARDHHGSSFVFLTGYPAAERPFYTMRDEPRGADARVASRSFDLLWRGMEVTSGCQREHRHERLRAQALDTGIEAEALRRYLDGHYFPMFRYGCPPHGGFGIGLDRLLMALLARPSIRETSFVYRGPGRFVP